MKMGSLFASVCCVCVCVNRLPLPVTVSGRLSPEIIKKSGLLTFNHFQLTNFKDDDVNKIISKILEDQIH